jgi:NADPH:quinone reductase-like Zn-dependent oxidoreductase
VVSLDVQAAAHLGVGLVKTNARDLQILDDLFTAGKLRSVVEQVFEFEQLPEAHLASMAGRTRGKIVVHMARSG